MTPAELRTITNSLGKGGQTELARLLGWSDRTVRNKLAGKTAITQADVIAICAVLNIKRPRPEKGKP